MNSVQKVIIRRRLERAHKDVVIDLCLRLMEANGSLTRQLAHELVRHPSYIGKSVAKGGDGSSENGALPAPCDADEANAPCGEATCRAPT